MGVSWGSPARPIAYRGAPDIPSEGFMGVPRGFRAFNSRGLSRTVLLLLLLELVREEEPNAAFQRVKASAMQGAFKTKVPQGLGIGRPWRRRPTE